MRRLALLLLAVLAAADEGERKLPKWKAGEQAGKVTIRDKEESFVALVPKGYTAKKKWPVVLLAHGNGGTAANFLQAIRPMTGKKPPLLVSLERCDNQQDAVGYVPLYLEALKEQFAIDEENVYALGFSGGGFRLWDDIVCHADVLPRFRAVVLVGCGRQSFDPPPKPERAPTVVFVGDPKDSNYGNSRPKAAESLRELGYEVLVHEHAGGHTVPRKEVAEVFEWIAKQVKASAKKAK